MGRLGEYVVSDRFEMGDSFIQNGRPRITVDITLLKYLRDDLHLGWLPIERKYYLYNKQRVSRDTLRRRYLEELLDRLERRDGKERCRSKILRYSPPKTKQIPLISPGVTGYCRKRVSLHARCTHVISAVM